MDAGSGNGIADWSQAKRHYACDSRQDNPFRTVTFKNLFDPFTVDAERRMLNTKLARSNGTVSFAGWMRDSVGRNPPPPGTANWIHVHVSGLCGCPTTAHYGLLVRGKMLYGMRPMPVSTQALVNNDHGGIEVH